MAAVFEDVALNRPEAAQDEVWARIARAYAAFKSPFVPCDEDVAILERAIAAHNNGRRAVPLNAVILGVTPALALMRWPEGTRITAVEISRKVIDALWPGDIPDTRQAICASWLAIPREPKSCDVVMGDGSLATCRFPGDVRKLLRSVRNLLADDGLFVFRTYLRPALQETIDSVFDALFSTKGLSVDCFKMRLYMAMQRSANEGVAVKDAAGLLDRFHVNRRVMLDRFGWSNAAIEPFGAWKTSDAVYSFPTLDELRGVACEYLEESSVSYPDYELGQYCPTVAMRPRSSHSGKEELQ